MKSELPSFPYGAVYFRKSNPPRTDWERDYATAAEDGMNIFRHWFLWSAIEIAPGKYDWDDYDRQLDLAAQHGIKTIIAEMVTVAPEWSYRTFDHARYETRDGRKLNSHMHGSCAVGGAPGLCLDNDDAREAAGNFIKELASRYKDHPGLGGYDIWNECNYGQEVCYCPATIARFRAWLKNKYENLEAVSRAWRRYGFTCWEDVTPPRGIEPFPDTLDWLQFRIDNAYSLMRWRADLIRSIDKSHPVTAHGTAKTLRNMAPNGNDEWRAAAEVPLYGFTWVASRQGDETWKQFHAVDLVRAGCRGKSFWHAEAQGGDLWMQPQVLGRPREDGRIARPEDVRFWNLTSFMAGATGLLFPRWRSLLDGPLFGAFGAYGMDGARTPRSQMASKIAKWVTAPERQPMWKSRPVQGDLGIVFVPEAQLFNYAQQRSTEFYSRSMEGAYQAFFDSNIQADWVHIDDIAAYDLLYLPYPVMLKQSTADLLKRWVADGGTLISEGCPGYFDGGARAGTVQPNLGLAEMFGAKESYVEFTPDLLGDFEFDFGSGRAHGGIFLQAYEPSTGTAAGWYEDGRVAVVDHAWGKGRTRLVGTMAGAGYGAHPEQHSSEFFEDALRYGGRKQHVRSSESRVKARLHDGAGGRFLWVANPVWENLAVTLELSESWGTFSSSRPVWGDGAKVMGGRVDLVVPARDMVILELGR